MAKTSNEYFKTNNNNGKESFLLHAALRVTLKHQDGEKVSREEFIHRQRGIWTGKASN
jgi:hypothetical protein